MKFINNINLNDYNNFVIANKNCTIFQSPQWQEMKDLWSYKRFAVVNDRKKVLATAQVLIRKGLWYLPRGPILDYKDTKLLNFFLENLRQYAKKNGAKLIKIDIPEPLKKAKLEDFNEALEDEKKDIIFKTFKNNNFKHNGFSMNMEDTIQPRFETVCDLDENYFDNLPKHTKRLLKDVEKRFVVVKKGGIEQLDDLMFALSCTEKRKNIKLRNKEYFEKIFSLYGDDCVIYTAYINVKDSIVKLEKTKQEINVELVNLRENMHKKKKVLEDKLLGTENLISLFSKLNNKNFGDTKILCSAISVKYGKSSEMLYAGMNDEFSKIPAQYKVYVDTMLNFYSEGVLETSMGGVEGTLKDNLLKFKSHFNPNIVEHYGEFDCVLSFTYKLLYDYGLPFRRKVLKFLNSRKKGRENV